MLNRRFSSPMKLSLPTIVSAIGLMAFSTAAGMNRQWSDAAPGETVILIVPPQTPKAPPAPSKPPTAPNDTPTSPPPPPNVKAPRLTIDPTPPTPPSPPSPPDAAAPEAPATPPAPPTPHVSANVGAGQSEDTTRYAPSPLKRPAIRVVKFVQPKYPEEARKQGVGGLVRVDVVIDKDGKVIEARAVEGPELLRAAAIEAAKKCRFEKLGTITKAVLAFDFALPELEETGTLFILDKQSPIIRVGSPTIFGISRAISTSKSEPSDDTGTF